MNLTTDRSVIADPVMITPGRLTEILQQAGRLDQSEAVRAVTFTQDYIRSARLVHFTARVCSVNGPSREIPLVLKCCAPDQQMHDREVAFYRDIAPRMPSDLLIHCHSAAWDPDSRQFHLLLDDISASFELISGKAMLFPSDSCRAAMIRAIVQIQSQWWDAPDLDREDFRGAFTGPRLGEILHRRRVALRPYLEKHRHRLGGDLIDRYNLISSLFERDYPARLATRRNITLVHGDAHGGNFFVSKDHTLCRTQTRTKIIDWPNWGTGLATDDLTYMLSGWPVDRICNLCLETRRMHYAMLIEALAGRTGVSYSWNEYNADFTLSAAKSFLLAMAHLAADSPPEWAWENVRLADYLVGCL